MPNVHTMLRDRVEFQIESADRLFLNLYQPRLQSLDGVFRFLQRQRHQPIASPALLGHMTHRFVQGIKAFAEAHGIPVLHFQKGFLPSLQGVQIQDEVADLCFSCLICSSFNASSCFGLKRNAFSAARKSACQSSISPTVRLWAPSWIDVSPRRMLRTRGARRLAVQRCLYFRVRDARWCSRSVGQRD